MPVFSSALRYCAIQPQTGGGMGGAPVGGKVYLPVVRSSTTFKWDQKVQDETAATGDYYTLVDAIPTQPEASGTIVVPFKPSTINPLLTQCGLIGGDIGQPLYFTVYIGSGVDEYEYNDVYFTGGQMTVTQTQAAQLSLNFLGLQKPKVHAVAVSPAYPVYERAYRLKNLSTGGATPISSVQIFAETAVVRIDSITVHFVAEATSYHGSRGDGSDGPSDIILNRLGGGMDIVRAYQLPLQKSVFEDACGIPGAVGFALTSLCGTVTHAHNFGMPNAMMTVRDINAPDNAPIDETLNFTALRDVSGAHVAPMSITWT